MATAVNLTYSDFVELGRGLALTLRRLFPQGQTPAGYDVMVQWAAAMISVKETHHFYPVLCYFRFTDARYSMARTAVITLEAAALIRTALDPGHFRVGTWFRRARAARRIGPFALARLRLAGIKVTDAVEPGMSEYVRLRAGWGAAIVRLGDFLGYTREQIDVTR